MYEYPISLTLVKQLTSQDRPLSARAEFIRSTVRLFNEKSATSVINPKHIGLGENGENDIVITDITLTLTLYTTQLLNTPSKALRLLSTLLLDPSLDDNLADLISCGKLFRSYTPASSVTEEEPDISLISDSDLIKGLVEVVCGNVTANQRQALNEIKQLAAKYKLL